MLILQSYYCLRSFEASRSMLRSACSEAVTQALEKPLVYCGVLKRDSNTFSNKGINGYRIFVYQSRISAEGKKMGIRVGMDFLQCNAVSESRHGRAGTKRVDPGTFVTAKDACDAEYDFYWW